MAILSPTNMQTIELGATGWRILVNNDITYLNGFIQSITTSGSNPNLYAASVNVSGSLTVGGNASITGTLAAGATTLNSLTVTNALNAGATTVASLTSAGGITGTLATAAQPNVTSLGTLTGLTVSSGIKVSSSSTLTGTTAGNIVYTQPAAGTYKKIVLYANGYENTSATAQTITYPTAFTNTPAVVINTTGMTVTTTTTTLTLPASMGAAATGLIILEGI